MPLRRMAILAMTALLPGCGGSPPVHYHALAPAAGALPGGAARMQVEVMPIAVPERMNREELVLSGSGTELSVLDGERWAAPLEDEIRQVVDDALWRQLQAADSYRAPAGGSPGGMPQYRLTLRIERFEAASGRQAQVDASWTVRQLPSGSAVVCRAGTVEPLSGTTPAAAAAALSAATTRLAGKIVQSLAMLPAEGGCPE